MKNKGIIIILSIVIVLAIVLLPFIISSIYSFEAPAEFFITDLEVSDFLVYYASALTFFGTIILGILTLVQNKKAQEKADEVNKLQLELQKRSMELAEERYQQESELAIPKLDVSILKYSGHYLNPRIKIKNTSNTFISNITFISAYAKTESDGIIRRATDSIIKNRTLSPQNETILDLKMLNLSKRLSDREYKYYENIEFILEFSCEDDKYNKHYFRATLNIPSSKDFNGDSWKVEKVG